MILLACCSLVAVSVAVYVFLFIYFFFSVLRSYCHTVVMFLQVFFLRYFLLLLFCSSISSHLQSKMIAYPSVWIYTNKTYVSHSFQKLLLRVYNSYSNLCAFVLCFFPIFFPLSHFKFHFISLWLGYVNVLAIVYHFFLLILFAIYPSCFWILFCANFCYYTRIKFTWTFWNILQVKF